MHIRYRDRSNEAKAAGLFDILAALSADAVASFPALRPHQRQAWHAFLVQVAAMALHRAGAVTLPETGEAWRRLLLALTPDWPDGEAWALVVEDWGKPALFQPPVARPANAADYRGRIEAPDALDMLVTAKNHDLKAEQMRDAADDHWLFALVSLQTQEGFMGAGNFGISRMNGGFGSRTTLGLRPQGPPGGAFRHDVGRLLAGGRDRILARQPALAARDGPGLLWLAPWDGQTSRGFSGLDPLYVEVCRRVRLVREDGRLVARTAGSKAARIEAKALTGRTGDPWAPVPNDGEKAYTPTRAGFGYRQVARLMNPKITVRPVLATATPGMAGTGLVFVFSAVVRGQGKTEGFHERYLPVPGFIAPLLEQHGDAILDRIGEVAQERADEAGEMGRILRHALLALMRGGRDGVRLDDEAAQRKAASWQTTYDDRVEAGVFDDAFWNEVAERDGPHRVPWRVRLAGIARAVLDEAAVAAPRTEVRRIRARAQASSLFERRAGAFVAEVKDAG
ncbi:hypothetical protein OPKNFCMD_6300 [Methylobacterium crusticola]|uniref:Type I-E CRISPR-associated protein Cse1/CasA n=1 Tax=Methylobacterium crusticola TaxID=1697972 RepID=A0ABQ4R9S0_9HYPH|nr:type I-E CRISPR-associated protein Cse1/CasA [Methylobacterium crusticola]GJD53524.1 hypothetical protein OPKNFCMD_6300 [Methylobacterium crusticola]